MSEHNKEIDKLTGVETTGHEWDGLKELNNPAPRWWVWVWVISFVWAVGYWVVYPAWPTEWPLISAAPAETEPSGSITRVTTGATEGTFGWTQYQELADSQAQIAARQAQYLGRFEQASYDQITKDPELYAFAQAGGNALFKNNCAVCHGSDAQGSQGFPNLSDDDWLWGGKISDIEQTIRYGIRSGHDEARQSQMPSFGRDEILSEGDVNQVVDYVLSLSSEEGPKAGDPGAEIFANNCASCHGDNAKGGRDFGAPNLTDQIWLYGGTRDDVYNTVFFAHGGVMPFWTGKLSEDDIRQLALYVHGLGGGESDTPSVSEASAPAPVEEVAAPVEEAAPEAAPAEEQPAPDEATAPSSEEAPVEPEAETNSGSAE